MRIACETCGISTSTGVYQGVPSIANGLHPGDAGATGSPLQPGWDMWVQPNASPTPLGSEPTSEGFVRVPLKRCDRPRTVELVFHGNHTVWVESYDVAGTPVDAFAGTEPQFRFAPSWTLEAPYGSGTEQTLGIDMYFGNARYFAPFPASGLNYGHALPIGYFESKLVTVPAGVSTDLVARFAPRFNVTGPANRWYKFFSREPMRCFATVYHE